MKQWGWLVGVILIVSTLPMFWPREAQSATPAPSASPAHRRHVNALPTPSPRVLGGGRFSFAVVPVDWEKPFGIMGIRLGMTADQVHALHLVGQNIQSSVLKRRNHTVELYSALRTTSAYESVIEITYDDSGTVAQVGGLLLEQDGQFVAVANRDLTPGPTSLLSNSTLNSLGPVDDVIDGVSVWYQDPVTIRYYPTRHWFILTQGYNDPI